MVENITLPFLNYIRIIDRYNLKVAQELNLGLEENTSVHHKWAQLQFTLKLQMNDD